MRRFVLKQNIERFEQMLRVARTPQDHAQIEALLAEARSEHARLMHVWTWSCPHLNISAETGATAQQMLDEVARILGAKLASLQFWDAEDQCFYLIAHQFDEASAKRFAVVKGGQGTVSEAVLAAQGPVIVDDVEQDNAFAAVLDWTRSVGVRSVHTTPCYGPSQNFLGTFSTHYAKPRSLTSHERELNAEYAARFGALFAGIRRKNA